MAVIDIDGTDSYYGIHWGYKIFRIYDRAFVRSINFIRIEKEG